MTESTCRIISRDGLDALVNGLVGRGYCVIGPVMRDGAIAYEEIESAGALPAGWGDGQNAGVYRLNQRGDDALFGYTAGRESWKRFLHVPRQILWRAERRDGELVFEAPDGTPPPQAFIGVRACELNAILIQDRVLLQGEFADPHYRSRRESCFIVAVNCGAAGGTCFCASMGTGPATESGYDLVLTELLGPGRHEFLCRAGSEEGQALLVELPGRPADAGDMAAAAAATQNAVDGMRRHMPAEGLREALLSNPEHPRWGEVAERCLSCANCTMVCPTCFCSTVEEDAVLPGDVEGRTRRWDSCFALDFSYIHGGSIRTSGRSRYRQWITHKLATWHDQFGESGCVGCGRCITWCPVGIDITEEAGAIAAGRPGPEGGDNEGP